MLITFIRLTYTPPSKKVSCQVDLTATARRVTDAGVQLVVGDIIDAGKLPFEDKQKISMKNGKCDLVVTHRRIDFHDSVMYIDMEFVQQS